MLRHWCRRWKKKISQPPCGGLATDVAQRPLLFHQKRAFSSSSSLSTSTTRTTSSNEAPPTTPERRVVCVALSGGVDSSVAAALLKESLEMRNGSSSSNHHQSHQYHLQAIHMSNWNARDDDDDDKDKDKDEDTVGGGGAGKRAACTSEGDWNDASRVARHLDINISRRCYESEYWLSVFEPYLDEIQQTPSLMGNPDVNCNVYIKFGILRDDCLQRFGSNSLLATGHYARLWHRHCRHDEGKQYSDSWRHGLVDEHAEASLHQEVEESLQDADHEWLWTWGSASSSSRNSFDDSPLLLAAVDRSKDQSYFLSGCFTHQFRNVIFPLGSYHKKSHNINNKQMMITVRQVAREMGLPTAEKKESMGICFVGKRSNGFNSFVQGYLPESSLSRQVDFVDVDSGEIISSSSSTNDGSNKRQAVVVHYNPGQGAKISGSSTRYFVVRQEKKRKEIESGGGYINNTVVWVCAGTHHPALYADSLTIHKMHWMTGEIPSPLLLQNNKNSNSSSSMRVQCRIRHLQPLVDCTFVMMKKKSNDYSDSSSNSSIEVLFDKPLRGITPGQRAVFYAGRNGLICLGGGVIVSSGPSYFEMGKSLPAVAELHPSGANDLSVGAAATAPFGS